MAQISERAWAGVSSKVIFLDIFGVLFYQCDLGYVAEFFGSFKCVNDCFGGYDYAVCAVFVFD
jgi:hypothetical protein